MRLSRRHVRLLAAVGVSAGAVFGVTAAPAHPSSSATGQMPPKMLGRYLTLAADNKEGLVFELTLRPAPDPMCKTINRALGQAAATCFSLGKRGVSLSTDPGARGPATVQNGRLFLKMTAVPYGKECEGSVTLYRIDASQTTLTRTRGTCGDRSYHRPS